MKPQPLKNKRIERRGHLLRVIGYDYQEEDIRSAIEWLKQWINLEMENNKRLAKSFKSKSFLEENQGLCKVEEFIEMAFSDIFKEK